MESDNVIEELSNYKKELALEWTLSVEEIRFVLKAAKGDQQILCFAAELKSLQNTGAFLEHNNPLSDGIISYLRKQLDIDPITKFIPTSRNTQSVYYQKIKHYLEYHDYAEALSQPLQNLVRHEVEHASFSIDSLKLTVYHWLKINKIIRPEPSVINRLVASYRKNSLDYLYAKLANKLSSYQKESVLLVLKRQPHLLSELHYCELQPPEGGGFKIRL
jgi:hypothetical protein